MGEHLHSQNDWMFTYSYRAMKVEHNRNGSKKVNTSQVLADFMVSPTSMAMQMHLFGLMYGVSEKFMLMGMMPYRFISMDHINRTGAQFSTQSEGMGDLKLSGTYEFYEYANQRLLFNVVLNHANSRRTLHFASE